MRAANAVLGLMLLFNSLLDTLVVTSSLLFRVDPWVLL
jgi:hypothetical protein